jgi:hypothetical protein
MRVAVDHLVNTVSLGHDFYFEEAGDTAAFPHLMVGIQICVRDLGPELKEMTGSLPVH